MNDQLLMDNYLLNLKSTVEVYVHGTLESSNADIRNILKTSLNEIMSCQANTYDMMVEYGWYPVEDTSIKTIKQTLNKIKKKS